MDASLLASAADVIQILRTQWDLSKIVVHSSIACDFVISQRCALIRLKWSELSSPINSRKIIEQFSKAYCLYAQLVVLVLDDREVNLVRTRTKTFDKMLSYMSQCATLLFSKVKSKLKSISMRGNTLSAFYE